MSDRKTAKSNIDTLNVPSVTNAVLGEILKDEICDNVVFKEEVSETQRSEVPLITLDFTTKDRIELTRLGGSLSITVSNIGDGQEVSLLIFKTSGQTVSFVGVTDMTPVLADVTALDRVLYFIKRVGSYYYAKAWVSIGAATTTRTGVLRVGTQGQHNALSSTSVVCVPGYLPLMSTAQKGLCEAADTAQIDAGQDLETTSNDPLVVVPSQLIRKLTEVYNYIQDNPSWQNAALVSGWTAGSLQYKVLFGNIVFLKAVGLKRSSNITGTSRVQISLLTSGIRPTSGYFTFLCSGEYSDASRPSIHNLQVSSSLGLEISAEPDDFNTAEGLDFMISYIR